MGSLALSTLLVSIEHAAATAAETGEQGQIVVEGLQKVYFNGNGVRTQSLEVDISDIDTSF